eukprot:3034300-Alexandrium_andersonii.AAC.1
MELPAMRQAQPVVDCSSYHVHGNFRCENAGERCADGNLPLLEELLQSLPRVNMRSWVLQELGSRCFGPTGCIQWGAHPRCKAPCIAGRGGQGSANARVQQETWR